MRRLPTGQGPYVEHRTQVQVRFGEVDAMRVAWHGHYIAWFEVGRESLGRAWGLSYEDMVEAGVVAPVVHVDCQYHQPARMGDRVEVVARVHRRRAAKLEFSYEIRRVGEDALLARGHSVQVFADLEGNLCIHRPPLLERFLGRCEGQWTEATDDPPRR